MNVAPSTRPTPVSASQQALELPAVLALIAHRAATDLGHQRILELRPLASEDCLRSARQLYTEAERLLARPLVPLSDRPLADVLAAIAGGGRDLDGRDLVEIAHLLEISADAAARLAEADPPCPGLDSLARALPDGGELRSRLRKTFDSRGQIRENATPRLAELRAQARRVRQQIYGLLTSMVDEHRDNLSEETVPMRGGRLVLMLQAGARGRIPGLVHGRSGTGKSFYFEPLDAVESNNQLQQAVEEEAEEKRRIVAEILDLLRRQLPAIEAHAGFVAQLDVLQAAARFATSCAGRLAELGERHQLTLRAARHPLLDPTLEALRREVLGQPGHTGAVTPLDLELDAEHRALVITGPNAGGKTVALKTVGLAALLHLCGLPVPAAAGSRIPFFSRVVATVGDEQDLLAERSTFSGRLQRLREAWDAAGPDSLVLLDELGSGTDPEEGAALSRALLEGLLERRSLVLVTTHLGQLAAAALELEGAQCAAMQFDSATGRPTYRLFPGPPGGSEALALARRMDLAPEWLARAEELLGSEHRDLRRLLAEVERNRRQLAEAAEQLEQELADSRLLRRRLEQQEKELIAERKALAKTFQARLEAFREQTAKQLAAEVERLKSELESGRRKGLAVAATSRLFEQAPDFAPPAETDDEGPLEVGATVRHRRLGWQGTLEKLERGRAQVRARGKIWHCRENELAAAAGESDRRPKSQLRLVVSAPEPTDAPAELKLIGQRVEPALEELDRYLDQALLASRGAVRIIHGHGSGRLRSAVREHLRHHPAVTAQRPGKPGEGGDGATIADLRID